MSSLHMQILSISNSPPKNKKNVLGEHRLFGMYHRTPKEEEECFSFQHVIAWGPSITQKKKILWNPTGNNKSCLPAGRAYALGAITRGWWNGAPLSNLSIKISDREEEEEKPCRAHSHGPSIHPQEEMVFFLFFWHQHFLNDNGMLGCWPVGPSPYLLVPLFPS